ncbi:MAG: hypothetical protein LBC35_01655 [Coriobacteriales bacterium]|nr:hypothetical protein [Coriobacteriales bacterium]
MVKAFAAKRPLSEELLLESHRILTEGTYDEQRRERGEKPVSISSRQ